MPSLVEHFRPSVHDSAITAASYDPQSGTLATADATGRVSIQRSKDASAKLTFYPGGPVRGALALCRGGQLVAVGDDDGTVGVYRTLDGDPIFRESREGERGRIRGMRGVALSPEGSSLASIAKDGLIRIWSLPQGDRKAWKGFSGSSVCFDARGQRLLAMDHEGQPQMMDLMTMRTLPMDRLQTPAQHARFTPDGTMVIAAGPAGISLLQVIDGRLLTSFATRGGSGISNLLLSPDGTQAAALTRRSIHIFSLPNLELLESRKHGAPESTGAAIWTPSAIRVAGNDGQLHSGGIQGPGQVTATSGFGPHRIAVHSKRLAVWTNHRKVLEIDASKPLQEAHIDRDGKYVVAVPESAGVEVYDSESGQCVFLAGEETTHSTHVAIGGQVLATQLAKGGCRWWDVTTRAGFELKWAQTMALSHGGTWLGVVTPAGAVRIINPATGKDAVTAPTPLADVPVRLLAFVNRRPDLLILDEEGVLGHYDLAKGIRSRTPSVGEDILTIHVPVDAMWGIKGGKYCALRLPENDRCSIVCVDIQQKEVIHDVRDLHPNSWVDAENGLILEPASGSAILERTLEGRERRVFRSLNGGEWVCFDGKSILDASEGAADVI